MKRFGMTALAARRIRLRPIRWTLLGVALALVTFLSTTVVLVVITIEATATSVITRGPALVVSRINAGGWASISQTHATRITAIPGVESATLRIWGVLPGPPAVTVMADPELKAGSRHALVGDGVATNVGESLLLRALDGTEHELRVDRSLGSKVGVVAHDMVLVPADTARALLLLMAGMGTDIAVDTARDEENDALVREIATTLKEPVRVTTRAQMLGAYRTQLGHAGTLSFVVLLPAILALVLLVGLTASAGAQARADVGKLKLLGWTSGEIARLHAIEMGLVGFVSVGAGLVGAYAGLFVLGGLSVTTTLLGWNARTPNLALSTEGAVMSLLVVGASVLLPCLVASLVPSVLLASADPIELADAP